MVFACLAMVFTVAIPWFTGKAVDAVTEAQDHGQLTKYALLILVAAMLRLVLSGLRRLVAGKVSLGVEFDLRNVVYEQLQRLELGFFDRQQTGQLMSRATVDLQSVRFFLGYGLIFIGQSLLSILLAGVAMLALQPTLALMALAPVPFVVVVAWRFGNLSRPALQEVQQRIAELTADAEENVSGVRVVKAFAREERQLHRFRGSVSRVFGQSMEATRIRSFYTPLIGFLPNLGLAVILFVGGRQVIDGTISIGEFTAFFSYLLMLIAPMRTLGYMLGSAQRPRASGARIFQILDREPAITAPPGAPPLPAGDGRVELRDVALRFEGASRPALAGVDLDIAGGTTVALVGPTGSGKTSLVSLLPRLYDVSAGAGPIRRGDVRAPHPASPPPRLYDATAGAVRIDGADVRALGPAELRGEIAVVTQDPFLFSATV